MGRKISKIQLEIKGELLLGPLVPQWFIDQSSDGASVPKGFRRVMKKKLADPAGYIHDWQYFGCAVMFEEGDRDWDRARMEADQNLKFNVKLISKNVLCRFFFSRLYLRAVRVNGGYVMKKHFHQLAVPPSVEALDDIAKDFAGWNWGKLTERAQTFIERWREAIAP